jgi:hypothetical protein
MAVPTAVWVGLVHPEITPPSNFHQLRDTTALDWVRDGLVAGGMLREVEVTAAMPKVRPWIL